MAVSDKNESTIDFLAFDGIPEKLDKSLEYKSFRWDPFDIQSNGPRGYKSRVKNLILTLFRSGEWTMAYDLENSQLKTPRGYRIYPNIQFKLITGGLIEKDSSKAFPLDCHMQSLTTRGTFTASNFESIEMISLSFSGTVLDC